MKNEILALEVELFEKRKNLMLMRDSCSCFDIPREKLDEFIKALNNLYAITDYRFMKFNKDKNILHLKLNTFLDVYNITLTSKEFLNICKRLNIIDSDDINYYRSVRFDNKTYKCYSLDYERIYELMKDIGEA